MSSDTDDTDENGSNIHGIDDTVRVAMGFILGGFATIHFDLGYGMLIAVTIGIVMLELAYGFGSVWYEAWRLSNQKNA
jgi:hypothetical protein